MAYFTLKLCLLVQTIEISLQESEFLSSKLVPKYRKHRRRNKASVLVE